MRPLWPPMLMFAAVLVARGEPSAAVELSEPLAEWKREIEQIRDSRVIAARIYTDTVQNRIILPEDTEQRSIVRRFLQNPNFLDEFTQMHAANLNYQGPEGQFHFILLNMARAVEWGASEDAVLAHEMGHVWLYAANYPLPQYEGKADSCIAIQAGDAVQHVVIRDEMTRRGIAYLPYWTATLERQISVLEAADPQACDSLPLCRTMSQVVLWLDVRLGLPADAGIDHERFSEAMRRCFPKLEPHVEELAMLLQGANLRDPGIHEAALGEVLGRMYRFARTMRAAGGPRQ